MLKLVALLLCLPLLPLPCMMSVEVVVCDAASREELRRVPMREREVDTEGRLFGAAQGPAPVGILIEPSGRRAFVANTNADIVTVLDLATFEVTARLSAGREPDGMAWIPARPEGPAQGD